MIRVAHRELLLVREVCLAEITKDDRKITCDAQWTLMVYV